MFERCYADDEYGAFWEKWVASCGESWRRPLTEQMEAMFPKLCSYATLVMFPGGQWFIRTPTFCYQRDDAGQVWCAR